MKIKKYTLQIVLHATKNRNTFISKRYLVNKVVEVDTILLAYVMRSFLLMSLHCPYLGLGLGIVTSPGYLRSSRHSWNGSISSGCRKISNVLMFPLFTSIIMSKSAILPTYLASAMVRTLGLDTYHPAHILFPNIE